MKNLFTNTIALLVAALMLLGVFSNFLANEEVLGHFVTAGLVLSAILLILFLRTALKTDSEYRERMERQGKSPLLGVIALALILPLFMVAASYKGLPVALNFLVGSSGSQKVVVSSKPASYHTKRCKGPIYVSGYKYFTNTKVCVGNKLTWSLMQPGSEFTLKGKKSLFGIHY